MAQRIPVKIKKYKKKPGGELICKNFGVNGKPFPGFHRFLLEVFGESLRFERFFRDFQRFLRGFQRSSQRPSQRHISSQRLSVLLPLLVLPLELSPKFGPKKLPIFPLPPKNNKDSSSMLIPQDPWKRREEPYFSEGRKLSAPHRCVCVCVCDGHPALPVATSLRCDSWQISCCFVQ